MKICFLVILSVMLLAVMTAVNANSEPVCSYVNSQGKTIFLKYFPLEYDGEDYVDYDANGKCIKRAICTETYETEVMDCSLYKHTCNNRNKQLAEPFPACCTTC